MRRFTTAQTAFAPPMTTFSSGLVELKSIESAENEKVTSTTEKLLIKDALACSRSGLVAHYIHIEGEMMRSGGGNQAEKTLANVKNAEKCMDACDSSSGHLLYW